MSKKDGGDPGEAHKGCLWEGAWERGDFSREGDSGCPGGVGNRQENEGAQ